MITVQRLYEHQSWDQPLMIDVIKRLNSVIVSLPQKLMNQKLFPPWLVHKCLSTQWITISQQIVDCIAGTLHCWKSKAHISSLCTILTQQGSILNPIQKSTICRDFVLVQYYLQITLNLLYHTSELVWDQPKTWWGKNHEYQRKQGKNGAWKLNYCQRRSWKCLQPSLKFHTKLWMQRMVCTSWSMPDLGTQVATWSSPVASYCEFQGLRIMQRLDLHLKPCC
jgi:hypothetical protein